MPTRRTSPSASTRSTRRRSSQKSRCITRLARRSSSSWRTASASILSWVGSASARSTSATSRSPPRRCCWCRTAKGNGTMAATFYSHAFSVAQESSQLAVVDAYDGSAPGALKIAFAKGRAKESAQLKPGTAVNLAPGAYQVSLDDSSSKSVKTVALSATDGGKHVAMRVGGSDGLPQESWCSSRRATPRSAAAPTGPAPLSSLRQRRCAQSCSREAARRVTAAQLRTAAQLQTQRSCRLRAAADAADVIFGGPRADPQRHGAASCAHICCVARAGLAFWAVRCCVGRPIQRVASARCPELFPTALC
ncbi:unnamed protein product [Prorocentrum cordatum]|uniref:DUF4397 domain-containing protein n=1 Tax=Prorocentrum cordatum TaxID=2364126 RepID=A0ABN9UWI9_9DINO|nr:unnamed protein product [Polarella glacialis]